MDMLVPKILIEKFFERFNSSTTSVLIAECDKYDAALFDLIEDKPKINFTLTTHQAVQKKFHVFSIGVKI